MSSALRRHAAAHFAHIDNRKLREHAAEVDLILRYFNDTLGVATGRFVEVGANDPVKFSQTHEMQQRGWRGILVEPIPALCQRLRNQRPGATVVEAACASPARVGTAAFHVAENDLLATLDPDQLDHGVTTRPITVTVTTLDAILDTHADAPVDFVSIDVEGSQLDVLAGFDLVRHKPKLLLIEDHLLDLRTHRALTRCGYVLAKRTGLNNWYIPRGQTPPAASMIEGLALLRKLYLGTLIRRPTRAVRRLIAAIGSTEPWVRL